MRTALTVYRLPSTSHTPHNPLPHAPLCTTPYAPLPSSPSMRSCEGWACCRVAMSTCREGGAHMGASWEAVTSRA